MSDLPYMPLFHGDFIGDTLKLNATETGAYLMLMMIAWRSEGCRLPDNDDDLAKYARCDRRTWVKIKPRVMGFWTLKDGFWTQARLLKEYEFCCKRAEVSRENGKRGGRPNPLKSKDPNNPTGSAQDTQTKTTHTHTHTQNSSVASATASADPPPIKIQIWDKSAVLSGLAGQPEKRIRQRIGQLIGLYADEALLAAMNAAIAAQSGDPFGYILRVLLDADKPRRVSARGPTLSDLAKQAEDRAWADHFASGNHSPESLPYDIELLPVPPSRRN